MQKLGIVNRTGREVVSFRYKNYKTFFLYEKIKKPNPKWLTSLWYKMKNKNKQTKNSYHQEWGNIHSLIIVPFIFCVLWDIRYKTVTQHVLSDISFFLYFFLFLNFCQNVRRIVCETMFTITKLITTVLVTEKECGTGSWTQR